MMALGAEDDTKSVGTHVNLEASISAAPVHDVAMLRNGTELLMSEFEDITMADVNKLAGTGWKKRHHHALNSDTTRPGSPAASPRHTIEGQPAGAAFEVLNLEEALLRFDLDKDGKLNEREQAALYRTIENEMLEHLEELHAARDHPGAADLHERQMNLRKEVETLQRSQEAEAHAAQKQMFQTASATMQRKLRAAHAAHAAEVEERLREKARVLKQQHRIEKEILEQQLAREQCPPAHHTKRCLELMSTEKQLAKGHDYKNAAWVKRMVDALEIPEKEAAWQHFEASQHARREALKAKHTRETKFQMQRNLGMILRDERAQKSQRAINATRFQHHLMDMQHAHDAEAKRKVELNDPPSALRFERRGYRATSSSLRGRHLQAAAHNGGVANHDPRGRFGAGTLRLLGPTVKPGQLPLYATPPPAKPHGPDLPNLTPLHDFSAPLLSTTTNEWTTASMLKRGQRGYQYQ